jgi:alpha-1,3-mannosyltransferase
LQEARVGDAVRGVAAGIILQGLLGLPFLTTYPKSYLLRAFEFSRVFTYKWSVNWQFVPEEMFTSQRFALVLLFLHLRFLWSFAQYHWFKEEGGILPALTNFFNRGGHEGNNGSSQEKKKGSISTAVSPDSDNVLKILFTSNFVGILCARSLHYQFYSWYFHTLPFLLLRTRLPGYFSVILLLSIEAVMNIFPPREWTSVLFVLLHASVLWCVWALPAPAPKVARTVIVSRNQKEKAAIA